MASFELILLFCSSAIAVLWNSDMLEWVVSISRSINPSSYMSNPYYMVIFQALVGSLILTATILWIMIGLEVHKKMLMIIAVQMARVFRIFTFPIY